MSALNTCSLIMQNRMKIEDILYSDLCYAPFVSPVWNIIQVAAGIAYRKLDKK